MSMRVHVYKSETKLWGCETGESCPVAPRHGIRKGRSGACPALSPPLCRHRLTISDSHLTASAFRTPAWMLFVVH